MPTCCCGRSANRSETGAIADGGGGNAKDDDADDDVDDADLDDDDSAASAVCVLWRSNECVAQKRFSIGFESSRSAELVSNARPTWTDGGDGKNTNDVLKPNHREK